MTPRERIEALQKRTEDDAKRHTEVAKMILARAEEEAFYAKRLKDLLPGLSDKLCQDIVDGWKDEEKAN